MDLARLARRQQGVVTRAQALDAGLSAATIRWRLERRDWTVVHPGVYLLSNGAPDWRALARAALLRCGAGSVLALTSAAYLWRLERTPPSVITVAVPASRHPETPGGVIVVRRRRLDAVQVDGLPVTRLATTVLDVADRFGCSADDAVALAARACQERSLDAGSLLRELEGRARHRLRRQLLLALWEVGDGAESLPETWFRDRVERPHGLPPFERQVTEPDRTRSDLRNRTFRTIVEIDGRLWHAGERFHLDRKRDRAAAGRGEVTLRVTPLELDQIPCEVARDVALTLERRGWSGQPKACSAGCPLADEAA
ncbi:type IV toxin-antitoxin system AbiEi family antitoxin domain-containing protein [Ornithinimicrobium cerasi]|uniref:type IV toxin-antitoxin system AbiEi family antitoxin domain-containing protein n=1 Tax=Ornithinimicrobium cerasi TaxID=2248773 RepID=UPI000EFFD8D7|nr:type IV toxin-antitoxin system AbiEi family antitoxin domain-containing protein [Ornithinimicrobium cerasi]